MIVLAVASRTTQAITGATSYSVGVTGNTSQFARRRAQLLEHRRDRPDRLLHQHAGPHHRGGGNFTGGKVRVLLYALAFAAPTS